jgi:hypothetical protein
MCPDLVVVQGTMEYIIIDAHKADIRFLAPLSAITVFSNSRRWRLISVLKVH